jgi:hypothetical protein
VKLDKREAFGLSIHAVSVDRGSVNTCKRRAVVFLDSENGWGIKEEKEQSN